MRAGLSYFNDTIFAGFPKFVRRMDSALINQGLPRIPLDHSIVRFSSWMGGDRDGNPFVTATCTRDVVYLARITAVNLYFNSIQNLIFHLSMWRCTDSFKSARCSSWKDNDEPSTIFANDAITRFLAFHPHEEPYG